MAKQKYYAVRKGRASGMLVMCVVTGHQMVHELKKKIKCFTSD